MGFWKDIKQSRAKRLVRQADSYLSDFHKRFAYSPKDAIAKCRKAIRLNPDYAEYDGRQTIRRTYEHSSRHSYYPLHRI